MTTWSTATRRPIVYIFADAAWWLAGRLLVFYDDGYCMVVGYSAGKFDVKYFLMQ
jgi:hypothetical protein